MGKGEEYINLSKINNKNIKKRCEVCSKLTIKAPKKDVRYVQC